LALLTGARPFLQAAGDSILAVKREHFGHARRGWADKDYFGIVGGRGDPKTLRRHLASLRAGVADNSGVEARQELRERIGKLIAGSATLWVGGPTQPEIAVRVDLAKRTSAAIRGALMEGVVPGGGVALLDCRPALASAGDDARDPETRVAYRILCRALEAPARAIISNAGGNEAWAMAEIDRAGMGFGFDADSERVVSMAAAGIVDAASVVRIATTSAVTTAALALTTDVLVHHTKPVKSFEP
jgi:chaperonin GroEL